MTDNLRRQKARQWFLIFAWGLYDLANQFFVLNVVSLYFVRWLTLEKGAQEIFYSLAFGISTFLVAALAPVLGIISDIAQRRRPFLVCLTLLSIIFTMLLGFYKSIFLGLLFFAIANFGCQLAIVFYNAQMVNIVPRDKIGLVSGVGRMLGYSGAILALYLIKPVVLKSGYQATFLPTGILFLFFSLPCMIFIKDKQPRGKINLISFLSKDSLSGIFKQLKTAAFDTYKFCGLLDFLKSAFFSLCAVNVILLFMSIYATRVFGLGETAVINLIVFATIFAIAGSYFSGLISDHVGHKRCLVAVYILWGICFLGGALARNVYLYWFIAALVGLTLGSTWVIFRALALNLVPAEKIGEIFGLFNLVGYLSSILGSLFWATLLLLLNPLGELRYRIALLSLALFMLLSLIFLWRVPDTFKREP